MSIRRFAILLLAVLWLPNCGGSREEPRRTESRIVVLGFDGVDPDLVREWIDVLPNTRELINEGGSLLDLGTTNPPESPVAWASFSTGMNPGKHGIFDFLRRDPETYFPDIGLVEVERAKFLWGLIPIKAPRITNNRKGRSYWKHLDSQGIATVNLRMPLEFPAEELKYGITWSGLSVPDVRGTWGTYFYLASDLTQWDLSDTEFGGRLVRLEFDENNIARVSLDGPVDPRTSTFQRITAPVEVERASDDSPIVTIRLQGQEQVVEEGHWSDWFRFTFSIGPFISFSGVSRFHVLETFPETRLYLMPISLDPAGPPVPLSQPPDYLQQAARQFGLFKTLGWIHETWGLNEEQINEELFMEDLFRNMENLERQILAQLDLGQASVYSAVFTATDSVSHMFFRLMDPRHPRYDEVLASQYGEAVLQVYQKMDTIIGEVKDRLGERDLLLVASDHGFHSWRREFNTNTWLVRNGYMSLGNADQGGPRKLDDMFSGGSFFPNVDWSRTRAYSLGLGHIYINLKGREAKGIVESGEEYRQLIQEIRSGIAVFRDPDTGERVIQDTYFRDEIYTGAETEYAGDIQITFQSGYRTSWQTALGAVPAELVVPNTKKWSGDHCASDFTDTAGFLLSNRRITSEEPSLLDIAPTLYEVFDLPSPPGVDGMPLEFDWAGK